LSTPPILSPLLSTTVRKQIRAIPQIQSFLESVLRNSKSTRNVYESGINYFHVFLDQSGLNHNAGTYTRFDLVSTFVNMHCNHNGRGGVASWGY
jgi:hypothetical protein